MRSASPDDDPAVTDTDLDVLRVARGEAPGIILTPEMFEELVKAAGETMRLFEGMVTAMTLKQARYVRELRVDQGYTWRAVAATCYAEWGGTWEPPSNQIMGMALCEKAATFFDENGRTPPWN